MNNSNVCSEHAQCFSPSDKYINVSLLLASRQVVLNKDLIPLRPTPRTWPSRSHVRT